MAIATAPGKINLIGGYSILEKNNTAFGLTINKRATAKAEKTNDKKIEIYCPDLNVTAQGRINEKNEIETETKKETLFVETALRTTFAYLQLKNISINGVKITTHTDLVFASGGGKSGLGASAAITVATVAALLGEFAPQIAKDKEIVHKLSQFSHATAQGKVGSGWDVAQACYGSCKYSRFSPEIIETGIKTVDKNWGYAVEPLALPSFFQVVLANIVGKSTSTTSVVKKVYEFKQRYSAEYSKIIKELDAANRQAIDAIEKLNKNRRGEENLNEFAAGFERGRMLTKELGEKSEVEIEPQKLSELIEESKHHGALVAKLPGAGGGDSIIALCTSTEDEKKLKKFWSKKKELQILDVAIDNRGFQQLEP